MLNVAPRPAIRLSFRLAFRFLRLGVSASTPFIGLAQNNFSHLPKNYL
jgi:hypothetical protein